MSDYKNFSDNVLRVELIACIAVSKLLPCLDLKYAFILIYIKRKRIKALSLFVCLCLFIYCYCHAKKQFQFLQKNNVAYDGAHLLEQCMDQIEKLMH